MKLLSQAMQAQLAKIESAGCQKTPIKTVNWELIMTRMMWVSLIKNFNSLRKK
jgi:hypothetical protein